MDQFPQMLYRCPGAEPIHGSLFETRVVGDVEEHKAAIKEGFSETPDDAKLAFEEKQRRQSDETRAPSREELETKAANLGIEFTPRVSDKKLGELIAEKLKAP